LNKRGARPEPKGARELAFDILLRVEQEGGYASLLLQDRERLLGDKREAALLHELVLGSLRRQAALDHAISLVSNRPAAEMDPEVRAAARLGAYGLLFLDRVPDFAAVNSAVELVRSSGKRSAVGFVNAILRAVARQGGSLLPQRPVAGDPAGLALFHSHPAWWVRRLVERSGWRAAERILEANNRPAATVLHANTSASSGTELATSLRREGIATEPCGFMPDSLRLLSGSLHGSRTMARGEAWVQDEAAQLVTRMLGVSVGPRVADLCAAPGGKSMQLATALMEGGLLIAVDRHLGRLGKVRENLSRIGHEKLPLVNADMADASPPFRPLFDQVLVDAPCSGTGTLRRHPEIRWRLEEEQLKLLTGRQRRILRCAAGLVVSGGSMAYAVCSMEPEEGEEMVTGFLSETPGWRLADPRPALPPAAVRLVDERGFLRTSPDDGGLDGFFGALLSRA
jgi:16S rRNA (cytosine967-C5)-methyltransferase